MADGEPFKSPKREKHDTSDIPEGDALREGSQYRQLRDIGLNPHSTKNALPQDIESSGKSVLDIVTRVEQSGGGGTHGEVAIYKAINALIMASQTTAAIGSLDPQWTHKLKLVIQNQEILDRVARAYWWGEDY